MARTLVNAHQLAPFSGSTAVQVKVDSNLYNGPGSGDAKDASLNLTSGSLTEMGTLYFTNGTNGVGGSIAYESSAFQFYGASRFQGNLEVVGTLTADTSLTVDAITLTSAELGVLDGLTAGTVAASKAVTVDANSDFSGARNITITGELDAGSLDISGNADIDGTLEADAITIDGTAMDEFIADTVGAMVGSNTETGIAVTYEDGDNTLDFVLGAAQTTITSILATDLKIGEDDQTKIDFETADEIHFYAANAEQVYVADGIFGPQTDSDVDLGSTGVRWKDAFVDTLTTTANVTVGGDLTVQGTTTTVNTVTMEAANAVVFEGATADDFETTLTIVDPTADRTQRLIDQSGWIPLLAASTATAITSTPAELNLLDGGTAVGSSVTVVDADGLILHDGGVMKTVPVTDLKTYIGASSGSGEVYSSAELRTSGELHVSGTVVLGHVGPNPTGTVSVRAPLSASYGLSVFGEEGADGLIFLAADEADDADDRWQMVAMASAAQFQLRHGSGTAPISATSTGNVTILGDLTITGDDLIMGTNTSGFIMVADGNNFNPVAVSGDVGIDSAGAVTISANAVEGSMLNNNVISGQTELNSATVAQADELMFSDAGTLKKITFSNFEDSIFANISGDATVAAGGALTLAANSVSQAQMDDDAIGPDELAANAVTNAAVADGTIKADKLDIDGSTDIGADLVDADLILVDDGAGGTNRRSDLVRVKKYIYSAMSGDATSSDTGALTIAAGAVESSMLNANAISGHADIGGNIALTDELLISDNGVLRRTDVSRLALAVKGDGLQEDAGTLKVAFTIDSVRGSSGHNYNGTTGVYTLSDNAVTGSEMVFLNGQMLMPAAALANGDYTTATGSVELHPDLKLDGDDVLRVYYLE